MKTISKSLAILNLFIDGRGELSLEEIARNSGLKISTARRIVLSLIECGFMRRQKKRGRYSLGMKFLDFSQAVKKFNPVIDIAEPHLVQLGKIIGETVSLALWDGLNAVICRSILPDHPLKVTVYEGTMSSLHFNSLGKAIMAEMTETELNRCFGESLKRFTYNTITDVNVLKKHLINIRQQGAAVDDEEGFVGVRGVAAVFRNSDGGVAGAVTILGPSVRLTREKVEEYIPIVKGHALKISRALGYGGA